MEQQPVQLHMEQFTFKLADFEGPLDLLLYLVGKNKMDLHEIAILDLIDQYTAVINTLTDHRLDVASEFIEMAARLVQMKIVLAAAQKRRGRAHEGRAHRPCWWNTAPCKEVAATHARHGRGHFHLAVREPMAVELDTTYQPAPPRRAELEKAYDRPAWAKACCKRTPTAPSSFEPLTAAPIRVGGLAA